MDLDLKNVHVVVTGASGGIGLETVQLFLEQGARVTAHYNSNSSTLQPLLATYSLNMDVVQANLTQEQDVITMFNTMSSGPFGPPAIAIVNHGVWPPEDVLIKDMSLKQWTSTLDTNLTSSFLVSREYMRHLETASDDVKAKASLIFIGSCSGKFGEAYHGDYSATKSALMYGMTLTLKNEIVKIAPRGRVNTVAPGWVMTPMAEDTLKDPKVMQHVLATYALKKVGLPYDVATQVVFLSSAKTSGHVSGEVIMVNGGQEGRLLNPPEL